MAYSDIVINQGTDFSMNVDLAADDGTPINVANCIFTSKIRKSYYSTNVTANIVVTTLDAPNGNLVLSLDVANTSNIEQGRYLYDLKMKDASNVTSRILEGIVTISPQVSY